MIWLYFIDTFKLTNIIELTFGYWQSWTDIMLLAVLNWHYVTNSLELTLIMLLAVLNWHYVTDIPEPTLCYWHPWTDIILCYWQSWVDIFYLHHWVDIMLLTVLSWHFVADSIELTLCYWQSWADILLLTLLRWCFVVIVDGLVKGREYEFRVRAKNQAGLGEPSHASEGVVPKEKACE